MLISVIVPVYKVEPYIHRCVDSIINQTYNDLEIILVDDGSPDNCGAICEEYAKLDKRIKVIHKENGGLSSARNAGLDIAQGDYIAFVDSDDYIELNMYENLFKNSNDYHADISVGGVIDCIDNGKEIKIVKTSDVKGINVECLDKEAAIKRYLLGSWSSWNKIYAKSVFDNIRFPVGKINEDENIALLLLEKCHRVVYTTKPFYHYIRRENSITTVPFSEKRFAWYDNCKNNLEYTKLHHPSIAEAAEARFLDCLLYYVREITLAENSKTFETRLKQVIIEITENKKLYSKNKYLSFRSKLTAKAVIYGYRQYKNLILRRHGR
ncbi:MAG: glycosyltransferase [Oscillospiraceae bacterium]|nr:glycosyltransferase [Oscillospiraceae bacterium]